MCIAALLCASWSLRLSTIKKCPHILKLDHRELRNSKGHKMGLSAHCRVILCKLTSDLDSWDWVLSKIVLTCSNRTTGGWELAKESFRGWWWWWVVWSDHRYSLDLIDDKILIKNPQLNQTLSIWNDYSSHVLIWRLKGAMLRYYMNELWYCGILSRHNHKM